MIEAGDVGDVEMRKTVSGLSAKQGDAGDSRDAYVSLRSQFVA